MSTQHHTTPWGLLQTKALVYALIGILMLAFIPTFRALSGQILGGLFIVAGIFQLSFSFKNKGTDESNIWGILYGLSDVAFGIAVFVDSLSDPSSIPHTVAFWALLYVVLQSVQAMYSFIAARGGSGIPVTSMLVHGANVVVAGGMAYVLLSFATGFDESMRLSGPFPIGLGALIIVLIQLMRAQTANEREHRMG